MFSIDKVVPGRNQCYEQRQRKYAVRGIQVGRRRFDILANISIKRTYGTPGPVNCQTENTK
jgi:hypothetical protein